MNTSAIWRAYRRTIHRGAVCSSATWPSATQTLSRQIFNIAYNKSALSWRGSKPTPRGSRIS
eukprot:6858897-Prorocentrum_lima.AAC.1